MEDRSGKNLVVTLTLHDLSDLVSAAVAKVVKELLKGESPVAQNNKSVAINKATAAVTESSNSTVRNYAVKCFKQLKSYKNSSGAGYKEQTIKNKRIIYKHIVKILGDMELEKVKPSDIYKAIRAYNNSGDRSDNNTTSARIVRELYLLYNKAIEEGLVEVNPAAAVKIKSPRVKRKRLDMVTWRTMYNYAKEHKEPWVSNMLILALVTGQRRADLAKMKYSDISGDFLHVEQQKEAGKGFGARVAIPLDLRVPTSKNITLRKIVERSRKGTKGDSTLLRSKSGAPLSTCSLSLAFQKTLEECINTGLVDGSIYRKGEYPSLHEVRSLSARMHSAEGIDVQTLLGHKNPEMTAIYKDDRGLSAKEYKKVKIK